MQMPANNFVPCAQPALAGLRHIPIEPELLLGKGFTVNVAARTRLLATLLWMCLPLSAAELKGTVADESGAAIAHARIELRAGRQVASTASDDSGAFQLSTSASAGTITVTARGFAPLTATWNGNSPSLKLALKPASVAQEVIVTAERGETPIAATASNVISLSSDELDARAAPTLDDALRQAPGFTLFRRASSLSANPTTQGASVRGIGASGASRILVLQDGVPLNDPFGGWVFWDRTPRISLDHAEVLRGGGANLYGNSALGGVVDLLSLPPTDLATMEVAGDSLNGHDVEGYLSHRWGPWAFSGTGENFGNDGAFIVRPQDRGLADAPADLHFSSGTLRVERNIGSNVEIFTTGSLFAEERGNGTLVQVNSTHLGELTAGLNADLNDNVLNVRIYGTGEHYHQSFSSISADRNSESLVRWQTVPSDQLGFSTEWTHLFSLAQITAGVDGSFTHGESDETLFTSGLPTSLVAAGGTNRIVGVFGEVSRSFFRRLRLSAGARLDTWSNTNGFNRNRILRTGAFTASQLQSHDEKAASPRAGLVYDLAGPFQIIASAYGGFRAPTLNELYRSFRLGNVVTVANEQLRAEHLAGGEAGVRYARNHMILSAVYFHEDVNDPVGNITLSATPALITRQRQNIGSLRAQGLDADMLLSLRRIQVRAGYEFVNSQVTSFSAQPALVGKIVPQVPAHVFTFSTVYNAPHGWNVEGLLRASSRQFDDDQNVFILDAYSNTGISLSKRFGLTSWFVSASNLFNANIETAATPLPTIASPRIISGGVRLTYGRR
jgi:outer membrane receptor protein involved in Fe transport